MNSWSLATVSPFAVGTMLSVVLVLTVFVTDLFNRGSIGVLIVYEYLESSSTDLSVWQQQVSSLAVGHSLPPYIDLTSFLTLHSSPFSLQSPPSYPMFLQYELHVFFFAAVVFGCVVVVVVDFLVVDVVSLVDVVVVDSIDVDVVAVVVVVTISTVVSFRKDMTVSSLFFVSFSA